jgi:hypothetical protein
MMFKTRGKVAFFSADILLVFFLRCSGARSSGLPLRFVCTLFEGPDLGAGTSVLLFGGAGGRCRL